MSKRFAAALAVAAVALAAPAAAQAHHVISVELRCMPPTLAFTFDADSGMTVRLDWNHDQLIQTKHLVGRGSALLEVPAAVLSASAPTSVRITALPALDEGAIVAQTSGPCIVPPTPTHAPVPPPVVKPPPIVTPPPVVHKPPPHRRHHKPPHRHHPPIVTPPVPTVTG